MSCRINEKVASFTVLGWSHLNKLRREKRRGKKAENVRGHPSEEAV